MLPRLNGFQLRFEGDFCGLKEQSSDDEEWVERFGEAIMKNQKYVKDESWILPGVGKVFDALSTLLGKSKEWSKLTMISNEHHTIPNKK